MVVQFLLASDTVKCRLVSPERIHLRNKKKRFKEKALEKVRILSTDCNCLHETWIKKVYNVQL